jgi:hypothetical protein
MHVVNETKDVSGREKHDSPIFILRQRMKHSLLLLEQGMNRCYDESGTVCGVRHFFPIEDDDNDDEISNVDYDFIVAMLLLLVLFLS